MVCNTVVLAIDSGAVMRSWLVIMALCFHTPQHSRSKVAVVTAAAHQDTPILGVTRCVLAVVVVRSLPRDLWHSCSGVAAVVYLDSSVLGRSRCFLAMVVAGALPRDLRRMTIGGGSGRSAHAKVMMWDDALASEATPAGEAPPLPPAAATSAVRVTEVPQLPQLPPAFQVRLHGVPFNFSIQ